MLSKDRYVIVSVILMAIVLALTLARGLDWIWVAGGLDDPPIFGIRQLPLTALLAYLVSTIAAVVCLKNVTVRTLSNEVVDELAEGLWEKLVWNIPFNGLGVAASAGSNALESGKIPEVLAHAWTTDRLLADTGWEERIRELMLEIINIAAAKNIGLKPDLAEHMIHNTRSMGSYRPSTVIDFEQGRPFELESMFLEPLRQARATDVSAPRLEALCVVLKKLASYLPRQ